MAEANLPVTMFHRHIFQLFELIARELDWPETRWALLAKSKIKRSDHSVVL